jgi:hypothetical protein
VYVCVYVYGGYVYVCMYVCVCVWGYVYVCMCVYVYGIPDEIHLLYDSTVVCRYTRMVVCDASEDEVLQGTVLHSLDGVDVLACFLCSM